MFLFKAAVFTNGYRQGQNRYIKLNDVEKNILNQTENILESYHYIGRQRYVDEIRNDGEKVFLDSGAFSAWNADATIDIDGYCDYIKCNTDILRVEDGDVMASVLDGIGDPQKTYENQLYMESKGVRPLPCFHFGEDERYLEFYIQNYTYITIGGMVGKPVPTLKTWLDRIWSRYLVDGSGKPRLKVHAFGITSFEIMREYPWYSVDSSSWIQAAAFGSIVTPKYGPVKVSDKSPSRHDAGQHITTLTQEEQAVVLAMLDEQGFDMHRLSTVYESRAAYNIWAYNKLNEMINEAIKDKGGYVAATQELF